MSPSRKQELQEERGSKLGYQAIERGSELRDQAVECGSQLKVRVVGCSNELLDQVTVRRNGLRGQAIDAAERARETVGQTTMDRWATLAGAGLALVGLTVIVREVQSWLPSH